MSGPEELRALVDERGLEAAELELSRVLAEFNYVMPVDGMHRVLTAYLLTRAESSLASPAGMEGWQLVPTEPNLAMIDAGRDAAGPRRNLSVTQVYRAMLSAAPRGEAK